MEHVGKVPCALVVTDGGQAADVVVVFGSPREADEFARRHGFGEWTVAPVRLASTLEEIRRDQARSRYPRPE